MAFMLKKSRSILLIVVAVALAGCTLSPTPQQRAERLIASGKDSMVELQQVENNLHDGMSKNNEFYHLGTELN
ncbi:MULTISPECIES: hypothetical protein [Idiomarina]|uniref:hypothetical protein n=1 Tax=Idiomarina TaxID=135575 RepID=UPI00129B775C|nr:MULTISPECIES: hypothetical protein [Idiomarina]MRJ41291.1 hypothetical protein [Idiomarina sp. FeN1]NCU56456.1 hypothetical protein [Idiomarina sp. FenA--70]NCU59475.1 hypothetical protein [Idiomarina sp. FenBw--71]UUN12644.1 hypothetical protein KGF88_08245 [Idiomarina loihiensis]